MTNVDHDTLIATLDRLKLTAIRDQLDTLLDEAARSNMTLREALAFGKRIVLQPVHAMKFSGRHNASGGPIGNGGQTITSEVGSKRG